MTDISDDTGVSGTDEITSDNTLIFNGTAEADSTVEVFIDGVSVGTTTTDGAGNWSFDHTGTVLADNTYNITAQATDVAGNTGPLSAALPIEVDTTDPVAPVAPDMTAATDTGVSNTDDETSDNTPDFTVVVPAGHTATLYVDGVAVAATLVGGVLTPDVALADGPYTITYTVTDPAGNESPESAGLPIQIDTADSCSTGSD